jgi:hypothetical protein
MALKALVQSTATVATDKSDYHPGETVTVTGSGWAAGEQVTLSFAETPFIDGPHVITTNYANDQGNFSNNQFVVDLFDGGISFTLTATGGDSHLSATTTFTDSPCSSGTGVVTVVGNNGSCVAPSPPNGGGPFNWEVVQGGSYTITITGVTECDGDTITVFVQNSQTGNRCFNATRTATGTYTGEYTMPNPACFTSPLSYKCGADQTCDNSNTFDARGPGDACTVHLRASIFGAGCTNPVEDTDCGGGPQGCICNPPADTTIECGTSTDPTVTGQGSCTGTGCVSSYEDSYAGGDCGAGGHIFQTLTRTWKCTAPTGEVSTCPQTITIRDTTPPTITTCPEGTDLGCNPETTPTCDSVKAHVVAHDTCSDNQVTLDCQVDDSDSGCTHTRKFTIKAKDACNNTSDPCVVTYTWKVDTTAPVLHDVPSGGDLGCNPTRPSCDTGVTATDNCDGTVNVTCTPGAVTDVGTCGKRQTFTYSAHDTCGNPVSTDVTYTWKEDTTPPQITCPVIDPIQLSGDSCSATVNYTPQVSDNCGEVQGFGCSPPSGSVFPPGVTTVTCRAVDTCGNPARCQFNVTVYTSICVKKFYDANANGLDDDGQVVNGFKIVLSGAASATGYTNSSGVLCFTGLLPGNYTVTEVAPNSSWQNTTPKSVDVNSLTCPQSVKFGNYCFSAPSKGLTLGFWTNRNGQNILEANATTHSQWVTLLNSPCGSGPVLRNADGTLHTFSTYSDLKTWLNNATATNMAYMLSAQLATNLLDEAFNNLNGGTGVIVPGGVKTFANVCIVPFLSVTQAITCGDTALLALTAVPGSTACGCTSNNGLVTIDNLQARACCLLNTYGSTTGASTQRTYEECVKDILDMINNNGNPPGSSAYPCGPLTQYINPGPSSCPITAQY